MIVIKIRNHQEVAEKESHMARMLRKLAPNLIRKKVEQRVAESIKESLLERGIEASISIQEPEEGYNPNLNKEK
ncbi:MAG: hypothetical protein B6245_15445 [Desulfobacteraceae bacterium 4572_88]|nr:MAG: hypothetical protein B6245_15445 [Desulfobacteraceae bacterium 4572_88]RLC00432.1 MAG: hypothetical protein DRI57_32300 [Deltaproteobacteria bacterium]